MIMLSRLSWPSLRVMRSMLLALPLPVMAGHAAPPSRSEPGRMPARSVAAGPRQQLAHDAVARSTVDGPALPRVAQRIERRESLTIVAFGSSSTQGVGASTPAHAYPSVLRAELEDALPGLTVRVLNRGIGGQDAVELSLRLDSVLADRPDLVIFQTGTNDPLRGLAVDRFIALTRLDITRLRAAGIDVMLMEQQLCHVTEATPAVVQYRDALRQLAEEMHVPLVRRWDLMAAWARDRRFAHVAMLAPDGLHMADAGYEQLADVVAEQIIREAGAPLGRSAPGQPASAPTLP